jgi:hypothetical protein
MSDAASGSSSSGLYHSSGLSAGAQVSGVADIVDNKLFLCSVPLQAQR